MVVVAMLTNFQTHVLRPLKVLHQTKTVGLLVTPDTLEAWPVAEGSESVLPVPLSTESKTLKHVTTGEANVSLNQKSAMQKYTSEVSKLTGFNSSKASAMSIRRPFLRPL